MLNARSLYTSALTPPPGMIFHEAIAATFSLDLFFLLEAHVHLARMSAAGETEPDQLSMLKAIKSCSKRITVYVQQGRIQAPGKPNILFGLLDKTLVQVKAPGGGVFHPKVWAIRFTSQAQNGRAKGNPLYRLLVLSKNMTADQSWDISLLLEGQKMAGRGKPKQNMRLPLNHFFKSLPGLAAGTMEPDRKKRTLDFAEELLSVEWEAPDGFYKDELACYLPGFPKMEFEWEPPQANRLAVVSPFCKRRALEHLTKGLPKNKPADALISRPDTLAALNEKTLERFSSCRHLAERAETGDGGDDEAEQPRATGLHAKIYIFELPRGRIHVVLGSANATDAALEAKKNIEILVELVGPKRNPKVGGLDDFLGEDGLGKYLVDFDKTLKPEVDAAKQEAEKHIEAARASISAAGLEIKCAPGAKDDLWVLTLAGKIPKLEGITSAHAWPASVPRNNAVSLLGGEDPGLKLGEFPAASVTGLIAFKLKTRHKDVTAEFVLNLPVTGLLPETRDSAITQTVISDRDKFIRYLRLSLGGEIGPAPPGESTAPRQGPPRAKYGKDIPGLLEDLTRAFCRHKEKLEEISELIRELSPKNQSALIDEELLNLLKVFDSAINKPASKGAK